MVALECYSCISSDKISNRNCCLSTPTKEIFQFILKNIANPDLNQNMIIDELKISKDKIKRYFDRDLGLSVTKVIRLMRIELSMKIMLEDERSTIDDIAFNCGFHEPKTFYRVFDSLVDKTPKEFREELYNHDNPEILILSFRILNWYCATALSVKNNRTCK